MMTQVIVEREITLRVLPHEEAKSLHQRIFNQHIERIRIQLRERNHIQFRQRIIAEMRENKILLNDTGRSIQFRKPDKNSLAPPIRHRMLTTGSNIIDLVEYRAKFNVVFFAEEPEACIKCDVFLPGSLLPELLYFYDVPEVGTTIIVEGISAPYEVCSVIYRATRPESICRPAIALHLRALRKKRRRAKSRKR